MKAYIRKPLYEALLKRLKGKPLLLQVIIGPRQVGKTTLVLQLYKRWNGPRMYKSADIPDTPSADWIVTHWREARALVRRERRSETLLVLDEVQKIPRWSEAVKKMFDEDRRENRKMRVVLLGSSSLLMQKGLTESLAGRFEIHRHPHWFFSECRQLFRVSLDEYLYFGGYPGALPMRKEETRWSAYIRDAIVETALSKDVLLMSPVTKPALLRQSFGLCVLHPAEILSYQKMMGQLQDAGNTTTLAFYLRLLSHAFLVHPLERYSGNKLRQRGSIPKIIIMDNALISASGGLNFKSAMKDKAYRGRLAENAIGAKLHVLVQEKGGELFYWRQRDDEVDFVIRTGKGLIAVEVKTGAQAEMPQNLETFARRYKGARKILIAEGSVLHEKVKGKSEIQVVALEGFFENPGKSTGLT